MTAIFATYATALYAGESELDNKHSINDATVLIHYPVSSYTQPLLSSSSSSQVDDSALAISSSSEQDTKLERDTFTEDLFPGVQPLQVIAQNISENGEREIKAYRELYQKMLGTLLPYFPQGQAPHNINTLRPVTDERSYSILVVEIAQKKENFKIPYRISPNETYSLCIPLFKQQEEGNLEYTAPKTTEEAYGSMASTLADFTSFRHERRMAVKQKLEKMKNYILVASFIGTTTYWMLYDKDHGISSREKAGDFFKNFAAHIAGDIILRYPIYLVKACMKRKDQLHNTQSVVEHTPLVTDVHPLVISLARQYVSQNLNRGLTKINCTNGICCWLWCCPLILGIQRILGAPLKDMPETTRITMLLEGSYEQLQKKLCSESAHGPDTIAAQRVQKKYNNILDGLYPLNEQNLDTIVAKTQRIELNQRRRNYLISIMRNSREQLKNCMPRHIRERAASGYYQAEV